VGGEGGVRGGGRGAAVGLLPGLSECGQQVEVGEGVIEKNI